MGGYFPVLIWTRSIFLFVCSLVGLSYCFAQLAVVELVLLVERVVICGAGDIRLQREG
jgi:hypothetical protein